MLKSLRALALAIGLIIGSAAAVRADQADYEMPTAGPMTFSTFLSTYLNPALQAIVTNNSGASSPTTTGQPETWQWWFDTSGADPVLKVYDGTAWLSIATFDDNNDLVTLNGRNVILTGSTSGTTTIQATAVAGTTTLTLPAATDTLVGKATTDTLTNKTLTSPVLTTPALGVATATSVNFGQDPLSYYDEGTWTPSLGGTTTYTVQTGSYTRNGRLTCYKGHLTINAIGTGSTSVVSGLPFAAANDSIDSPGAVGLFTSAASTIAEIASMTVANTSTIQFYTASAAGTGLSINAVFGDGTDIYFSGCYPV